MDMEVKHRILWVLVRNKRPEHLCKTFKSPLTLTDHTYTYTHTDVKSL